MELSGSVAKELRMTLVPEVLTLTKGVQAASTWSWIGLWNSDRTPFNQQVKVFFSKSSPKVKTDGLLTQKSKTCTDLGSLLWIPTVKSGVFWGRYNCQYAISLEKVLLSSTYWKLRALHVRMLPEGLTVMLEFLETNFNGVTYGVFSSLNFNGGNGYR